MALDRLHLDASGYFKLSVSQSGLPFPPASPSVPVAGIGLRALVVPQRALPGVRAWEAPRSSFLATPVQGPSAPSSQTGCHLCLSLGDPQGRLLL